MNPSTSLTNPSALVSFFICKYYILRFRALDVRTVRTSRDRALVYSTWDGAPPTIYIRTCQSNCFLEEGCREELKYKKKNLFLYHRYPFENFPSIDARCR